MTHLSKTHPGNPQGNPQIILLLIHQIGVFVVYVDQCPRKSKTSAANLKKCITLTSRFTKLCLDPDVLELCIRNRADIRNDHEDNSTRAFRKAAYRQFILARHGHLGKGNRRVCPSCVVLKIRERFPSVTGIYMGFREHRYFV